MFTGLGKCETVKRKLDQQVECLGTISGWANTSLTINAAEILSDCNLGDSICVNGTCLTVTEFDKTSFKVGVAPESLRRTNLGQLNKGDKVNLERAVAGHVRFGGHFVQGHVDTTAVIRTRIADGDAIALKFIPKDASLLKYIVEKGYIAIDGTSLTITAVDEDTFDVMLIAYSQERTVVALKAVGDEVNIEVDMIGKYVEKQVAAYLK